MSKTDLVKISLIGVEEWREYDFGGRVYRISSPVEVAFRTGGATHRVTGADGIIHIVPAPGTLDCVVRFRGALVA